LHRDWPDAGLNLAFRAMAVPYQAVTPVRQRHAFHIGEKGLGLRFDGLGQQAARAAV
jgi:hypothetical protein